MVDMEEDKLELKQQQKSVVESPVYHVQQMKTMGCVMQVHCVMSLLGVLPQQPATRIVAST